MPRSDRKLLRVQLLGGFQVAGADVCLSEKTLSRRRKSASLLKLLALAPAHVLHREQVFDALWPNLEESAANNSLYKVLNFLRSSLASTGAASELVRLNGQLIALSPDVEIDVEAFRRAATAATESGGDVKLYESALGLYGGDLLPADLYEPWTEPHREALRSAHDRLLREFAILCEIRGDWISAMGALERLRDETFDEDVYRALMRVHELAGDHAGALRAYEQCRVALKVELDVEPSKETEELRAALTSRSPDRGPSRTSRKSENALVGREREMQELRRSLESALAGGGGVVLIGGEPGIGKTRLTQAVIEYARLRGFLVGVGQCLDAEGSPGYLPWIAALREVLDLLPTTDLAAGLDEHARRIVQRAPEVAPHSTGASGSAVARPKEQRFRLFESVTQLLRFASGQTPTLLVLEDLQDADPSALQLLRAVARELSIRRVVLLATYRDTEGTRNAELTETLADLACQQGTSRIKLTGLNEPEVGNLVSRLLGSVPPVQLLNRIWIESSGNPLFAREYARSLLDHSPASEPDRAALPVPETVRDVVMGRVRRLSPECSDLLAVASVVGRRFDVDVLARALPCSPRYVIENISDAVATGILRPLDDLLESFEFSHDVIRKSVYESVSPGRLVQLHGAVGEAFESQSGRDHLIGELAHHFEIAATAGEHVEKAIGYAVRAGEAAARTFAWDEAIRHWERALRLMDRHGAEPAEVGDLLERLENLIFSTGADYQRGLRYLQRALELREASGDAERAAQIHSRLGRALSTHIGDPQLARYMNLPKALEHYRSAERVLAAGAERPAVGFFYVGLASAAFNGVHIAEGLIASEKAMSIAERLGLEGLWASAALLHGVMLKASGRLSEGLALLTQAYDVADGRNDPLVSYYAVTNIADWTEGYVRGSGELYRRELEKQRTTTAEVQRSALFEDLGCALCRIGRVDEARALLERVPQGFLAATISFYDGNWEQAESAWREGLDLLAAVGHRSAYANRSHHLAHVCRVRGDERMAERLFTEELEVGTDGGSALIEVRTRAELALLAAHDARVDEASAHVQRCSELIANGEDWGSKAGRVALAEGVVARLEGQQDRAERVWTEAIRVFQRGALVWDEAELHVEWARAAACDGSGSEARVHVARADALYRDVCANARWHQRAGSMARPSHQRAVTRT